MKKCTKCGKIINLNDRKSRHVCGEVYCRVCEGFMPSGHQCYMMPNEKSPKRKNDLFVFFDFETRQDEALDSEDPEVKVHKVTLCVSQQFCMSCIGRASCKTCSTRTRVFREDPVN